jgi:prevent-host-death family protein
MLANLTKIANLVIMEVYRRSIMDEKSISSTEFQNKVGRYIDESAKAPVFITRYDRPMRVLLDIDEYERLKSYDTRKAYYPHELGDDIKKEFELGYQGEQTPDLDHLMD